KLAKNIYAAGEVLDADGDCGGYNLHFAWCSAMQVATAILEEKCYKELLKLSSD
ncbi:MAG: NAD(P)/FAD-dependent oxidoreductase, partial [Clostridia bacterium]|nr:NAD(P)/FAD-dependent oxidoreductase [Clostridia bacterium]